MRRTHFSLTLALAFLLVPLSANPLRAAGPCSGDCDGDDSVGAGEAIAMVNIALGKAPVAACAASPTGEDGRVTIDEVTAAVRNALYGCPSHPRPTPSPTPGPLGIVQVANLAFSNLLPLVGTSLPSADAIAGIAVNQGLDALLDFVVAVDPSIREKIPGGVRVDFGNGSPQPIGTMTGVITATVSNAASTDGGVSFEGTVQTDNLTINGADTPFDTVHVNATVTQTNGGRSQMSLTLGGSGANPPATLTGTVVVDTAVCPNYPIGGSVTATVGGISTTISFNDGCNGTFGLWAAGMRQVNALVTYYSCLYESWYSNTNFIWAENGYLIDDLSDEDPPFVRVAGTLSDTDVHMSWTSKCPTDWCHLSLDGTFVGHLWKEEEVTEWGFRYLERHYVGTYTTHHVEYNEDGTVRCESTRVLDEQQGMEDWYHFIEIKRL